MEDDPKKDQSGKRPNSKWKMTQKMKKYRMEDDQKNLNGKRSTAKN